MDFQLETNCGEKRQIIEINTRKLSLITMFGKMAGLLT